MEFIESAGLMKTVTKIGRCYEKLVREYIVNITDECSEGSDEFKKVYVRGKCIKFSPTTINEYQGRNNEAETEEVDLLKKVTEEITGGQIMHWPKKGLLSTWSLSVKYAILKRIGAANWAPTTHESGITPMLAKLIYLIGTKGNLNFGEYVFNLTMKYADSFAVKFPIAFPSLITDVILSQQPDILHSGEI
ncbi:envelope-like protein [Trifolium medium]|uniref:Envelope-like protein n=1 Tax=Trifolium medium TaxID=97028 RepID=A0A392MGF8_9FABA|nr:envelope-like protein [Trifolium medium]